MKINKIKFEYVRLLLYVVMIILVAGVAMGKVTTSCYFKDHYNFWCPACGLTRATIDILKLNFAEAFKYNAFYTVVLVPFSFIIISNDIYVIIKRLITRKKELSIAEIVLGDAKNEHN